MGRMNGTYWIHGTFDSYVFEVILESFGAFPIFSPALYLENGRSWAELGELGELGYTSVVVLAWMNMYSIFSSCLYCLNSIVSTF